MRLSQLDLRSNNLRGSLNFSAIVALLPWLRVLRLDNNSLSGPVPLELVQAGRGRLHTLGLADNAFDYDATEPAVLRECWDAADVAPEGETAAERQARESVEALEALDRLLAMVNGTFSNELATLSASGASSTAPPAFGDKGYRLSCVGLPRDSCSAFGAGYRPSATEARQCVRCDGAFGAFCALILFKVRAAHAMASCALLRLGGRWLHAPCSAWVGHGFMRPAPPGRATACPP